MGATDRDSREARADDLLGRLRARGVARDGGQEVIAVEVLDSDLEATMGEEELERLRINAGTPRLGREIDDRVLPAEAGLEARAVDFEKGCYPGQEPVARQHYRGRVNRTLRVLEIDGAELPEYDPSSRTRARSWDA